MASTSLLLTFLLLIAAGNQAQACRVETESCNEGIPCCKNLKCSPPFVATFGRCQSAGSSSIVAQAPAVSTAPVQPSGASVVMATIPAAASPASASVGAALITLDEFVRAIIENGYPEPPNAAQLYENLISRIKGGKGGGIVDKKEVAMLIANLLQESKGFSTKTEEAGRQKVYEGDTPDRKYYGRGYIQLTNLANYAKASQELYQNDRLVVNPELVETDEDVAWDTALWYWSDRVHNAPGVSSGQFDATTKAINGEECQSPGNDQAQNRFKKYQIIFTIFAIPGTPDPSGC